MCGHLHLTHNPNSTYAMNVGGPGNQTKLN